MAGCEFPAASADVFSGIAMIHLTRLNNSELTINSDLIKFVEQSPDTVITLLNGEKILVRENIDEIIGRVIEFRGKLLSTVAPWIGGCIAVSPVSGISPHAHTESEG